MLAEATRIKADAGDHRAFLIDPMKFSEGGQRVEQTQQIVDCIHAVGLHVDIGDVVFGPGSSDSRESYCAVRMVATVGNGAQNSAKHVAEAFPHALTLPFRLDGLGGFKLQWNAAGEPDAPSLGRCGLRSGCVCSRPAPGQRHLQ